MPWMEDQFRANFTRVLDRRGFNQRELSIALENDETTVSKWMKPNGNIPPLPMICEIADALKVRPGMIAFGDDFEPMDDEELEIVESWRRLTEGERHSFTTLFREITKARKEPLKKIRVKRGKPAVDARAAPDPGSAPQRIPQEDMRVLQDLIARQLHDQVPSGSEQWEILDRVSKQLALGCAPEVPPVPTRDPKVLADSDESNALVDAAASTHDGKKTNRPSKVP